jgi:hypothetical protein
MPAVPNVAGDAAAQPFSHQAAVMPNSQTIKPATTVDHACGHDDFPSLRRLLDRLHAASAPAAPAHA